MAKIGLKPRSILLDKKLERKFWISHLLASAPCDNFDVNFPVGLPQHVGDERRVPVDLGSLVVALLQAAAIPAAARTIDSQIRWNIHCKIKLLPWHRNLLVIVCPRVYDVIDRVKVFLSSWPGSIIAISRKVIIFLLGIIRPEMIGKHLLFKRDFASPWWQKNLSSSRAINWQNCWFGNK